ncbi:hypothetical protein I4U23_015661 [Adineta vaga]|nr:hypothetical protein I4U23_015661 [Adineta vaga]
MNSSYSNEESLLNIRLNQKITFSFLISLFIPSIIFSCFLLSHIIRNKKIRNRLNNHVIICIFLIYFIQAITDLPVTMIYLYRGEVAISSDIFCKIWFITAGSLNAISIQMNAFLSFERYLLIFHHQFLHKYKIILHYLPLICFFLVPLLYVILFTNFYPCQTNFVYNAWSCGSACYLLQPIIGTFTWVYAILIPVLIMIIFNFAVLVRVIHQKKRMMQKNTWSKSKKMIFQLLSITGALYISWVPISIINIVNMVQFNSILNEIQATWTLIGLIYIAVLFSPVVSYFAIPELKNEIRWRKRRVFNNETIRNS